MAPFGVEYFDVAPIVGRPLRVGARPIPKLPPDDLLNLRQCHPERKRVVWLKARKINLLADCGRLSQLFRAYRSRNSNSETNQAYER